MMLIYIIKLKNKKYYKYNKIFNKIYIKYKMGKVKL